MERYKQHTAVKQIMSVQVATSVFQAITIMDMFNYSRVVRSLAHHPWAHKAAVAHTLRHRAGTHSSTFGALEKEKAHVMDALLKNGYPKRFIHQSVSIPHPPSTTVAENRRQRFAFQGVSEPLKRQTTNQDCAEATQDTETDFGTPKRCHPKHAEIKRSLISPVLTYLPPPSSQFGTYDYCTLKKTCNN